GLRIDGDPVVGSARALVESHAEALRSRKVHLVSDKGDDLGEATLGDLGVKVDQDEVIARATRIGHDGDFLARAEVARRAARGEIDVPLSKSVEPAPFVQWIARYKESLDAPPASARLDLD